MLVFDVHRIFGLAKAMIKGNHLQTNLNAQLGVILGNPVASGLQELRQINSMGDLYVREKFWEESLEVSSFPFALHFMRAVQVAEYITYSELCFHSTGDSFPYLGHFARHGELPTHHHRPHRGSQRLLGSFVRAPVHKQSAQQLRQPNASEFHDDGVKSAHSQPELARGRGRERLRVADGAAVAALADVFRAQQCRVRCATHSVPDLLRAVPNGDERLQSTGAHALHDAVGGHQGSQATTRSEESARCVVLQLVL